MDEGDGLGLETFETSYHGEVEHTVYILTCGETVAIHADHIDVGIKELLGGPLPEVSYDPEAVRSFFIHLAIKSGGQPKHYITPKWMIIKTRLKN